MGLNEAAGYGAVASRPSRPARSPRGRAAAGAVPAGAGVRGLGSRHLRSSCARPAATFEHERPLGHVWIPSAGARVLRTTFGDRSLSAACQAGLVNNLTTGWPGACCRSYAGPACQLGEIGVLAAAYPAVWRSPRSARARCRTGLDANADRCRDVATGAGNRGDCGRIIVRRLARAAGVMGLGTARRLRLRRRYQPSGHVGLRATGRELPRPRPRCRPRTRDRGSSRARDDALEARADQDQTIGLES